jgi:hypothetical protein
MLEKDLGTKGLHMLFESCIQDKSNPCPPSSPRQEHKEPVDAQELSKLSALMEKLGGNF